MNNLIRSGPSSVIALLLAGLLAAACGAPAVPSTSVAQSAATSPTVSPAASASVAATPEATPSPPEETTEPSASVAAVDPTEDILIADPYELEPLDDASAAAFRAGVGQGLGSLGDIVQFGAKTVTRDGEQVAVLLAMAFPDFPGAEDPNFFTSVLGGVAGSSGGAVEETTIAGKTVGLVEGQGSAFAGYQEGDTVIFAIGPAIAEVTDVITALIEANG